LLQYYFHLLNPFKNGNVKSQARSGMMKTDKELALTNILHFLPPHLDLSGHLREPQEEEQELVVIFSVLPSTNLKGWDG